MGAEEEARHGALSADREIIGNLIARHEGRILGNDDPRLPQANGAGCLRDRPHSRNQDQPLRRDDF